MFSATFITEDIGEMKEVRAAWRHPFLTRTSVTHEMLTLEPPPSVVHFNLLTPCQPIYTEAILTKYDNGQYCGETAIVLRAVRNLRSLCHIQTICAGVLLSTGSSTRRDCNLQRTFAPYPGWHDDSFYRCIRPPPLILV